MINFLFASAVITSSFYNLRVERVYDGDTVYVTIPGVPDVMGLHRGIRLKGIDAPEMHGKRLCEQRDAMNARESLEALTTNHRVDLLFCEREKFDRLLCVLRIDELIDASEVLLSEGRVQLYGGGKKPRWRCLR